MASWPLLLRESHVLSSPDSFDSLAFCTKKIIFSLYKANESNESGTCWAREFSGKNGTGAKLRPTRSKKSNESGDAWATWWKNEAESYQRPARRTSNHTIGTLEHRRVRPLREVRCHLVLGKCPHRGEGAGARFWTKSFTWIRGGSMRRQDLL